MDSKDGKYRTCQLWQQAGHHPGNGRLGRGAGQRVAFPLHDGTERWCCFYHDLYCVCHSVRHSLYAERVYHRPQGTGQYRPCLRLAGQWHALAAHRTLWRVHRLPHHRLLCGRLRLVPAVCLCLCGRPPDGRCRLREAVFRDLLGPPVEAHPVDAGLHADLSFHHCARC